MNSDLLLLRREVELERKAKALRDANQLAFFQPHSKQKLFFENAHYHYRYARTGNRFGKSEMGAAEDISFALGFRPWIPEGDPLRTLGIPKHATKGLIVTTDWDKSTEIFTSEEKGANQGKLFKYIPASAFIDRSLNHSGAIDTIRIKHVSGDVSVIHLDTVKSFKQNALGQESSSWDWAHFDEPVPQQMYKAIIRGFIDRDGQAWFTCTPLSEPWIDAMFIPDMDAQLTDSDAVIQHGDFWHMVGSTSDNPHNKAEAIERVMAQYTEEEQETRRHGIPRSYAGVVYKEFNYNVHSQVEPPAGWYDWQTPPANHCIYIAIDYHFRKNNAVLFIAVPPDGPAVVFHELWKQMLVEEEVAEIRAVLGERPYQPILMDPLASTPNKVTELTAMDEYRRHGLAVLPATKDPVNGIRSVKANLKARGKNGEPTIIFNRALKRTIFEIARGFIWDGEENRPVKNNDDMMENLYRLHLQGLSYIEPADAWDYSPVRVSDFDENILSFPSFNPFADEAETETKQRYASRYRK